MLFWKFEQWIEREFVHIVYSRLAIRECTKWANGLSIHCSSFQSAFLCYFKNFDSFFMCLIVFVFADFLRNDHNWTFLVLPQEVTLTSAHPAEIITPRDVLIPKLFTHDKKCILLFPLMLRDSNGLGQADVNDCEFQNLWLLGDHQARNQGGRSPPRKMFWT